MNKLAIIPILLLAIGAGAIVYGVVGSLSRISTGHVTITAPPEPSLSGNFTVSAHIYFPETRQGTTNTVTIPITSALNAPVTVTATSPGIDGISVTGSTTLPVGATVNITLTLTADADATLGSLVIPITFTAVA